MDAERKLWNEQQKVLRQALYSGEDYPAAQQLFFQQHAMLHSAEMAGAGFWSYEDQLWQGLDEDKARCIPPGLEHSIAWIIWHITRIEDVTMNMLVAGGAQVMLGGSWHEHMGVTARHTGNAMPAQAVVELSETINLEALHAYRLLVGRQTRAVVQRLSAAELTQQVTPARLQQLVREGAVLPTAQEVLDYWGGLTIAGLLLMPPTRHSFIHLNEAMKLRQLLVKGQRSQRH
jgi:hypothetical protein